jgi:predicted DNA-binding protein with PD1-like motif
MKQKQIKNRIIAALLLTVVAFAAHAQEYVSLSQPVDTGKAPGVKVKLLSSNGQTKTYVLVFSPGDEVRSGLNDFALKYNVKSAHYSAIGDVFSAKLGFFAYERKMFRAIPVDTSEIASFIGNITIYNGIPVAHTHVSVATKDGSVKGGHLLELFVGPTLEVFVTVEPTPLYKSVDKRFNAGIIDPSLEKEQ